MDASPCAVSMDINCPSFRCFANVTQSKEGLDLVFRQSFDVSDDESLIEIDLMRSSSKGIRVISIPKDIEFSFPHMGSTNSVDHDDELSVGPCTWPCSFDKSASRSDGNKPLVDFAPFERNTSPSSGPDNIKCILSSTRNLKPYERIVTACMKFLKPTFGCFRGQKPSSRGEVHKEQHPTARNIAIYPENSSSTITLAELFPKGLTENNGSSPQKSHKE